MGVFSNPKPIHPRFELPKVAPRECSRMSLPKMSAVMFPIIKWLDWQAKQKQDQAFWIAKILDSEEFWTNMNIDIGQFAFNIAHAAATKENLVENSDLVDDLFAHARLGVLAGMFEKASQATSPGDCHPLIWNAMTFFNMSVRDMEGRVEVPNSSLMLRECTTWAGYALGKVPNITIGQVFADWR